MKSGGFSLPAATSSGDIMQLQSVTWKAEELCSLPGESWYPMVNGSKAITEIYLLVNVYITMENHHFQRENPLFLWPFSIAFCMFTRGYNQHSKWTFPTKQTGRPLRWRHALGRVAHPSANLPNCLWHIVIHDIFMYGHFSNIKKDVFVFPPAHGQTNI